MGDLANLFEIFGQAGYEMTGLLIIEEAEGELLQMIEGLPAHLGLNLQTKHMPPIGDNDLEAGIDQIDQQKPQSGKGNQTNLIAWQQAINEQRYSNGKRQFQQTGNNGGRKIENEQTPMRTVVGGKTLEKISHDAAP